MKACTHKTIDDFTRLGKFVARGQQGRIWKCCDCGAEDYWQDGWAYYGNIECKDCWSTDIEKVTCPKCAPKQRKKL